MIDLPPPDPGIEIVLASRGMSKGIAQTEGPQALVRPEIAFGSFYISAYAKNVVSSDEGMEAGNQIGIRHKLAGIDWTASVTYKHLHFIRSPVDDEAVELSLAGRRQFGPATISASLFYSPNELGSTRKSYYGEAGASFAVAPSTKLLAFVGRRERDGGPDYTSFNFGIAHSLSSHLTAELRYYDTAQSALGENYHGRAVAALRATF